MADASHSCISLLFFVVLFILVCTSSSQSNKNSKAEKASKSKEKIGKNILDYTEADMYKLLDQWDENDDDDDNDEDKYDDDDPRKPKPKMPALDPSKLKDDPMSFVKMAKKGKTIMMFVSIANNPTKRKTEDITARWQMSLHNAHLQVERYIVADDRVLFLLKDGSMAWDVKDYIITQPECKMVEFENQKFPGAGREPSDTLKEKSEL